MVTPAITASASATHEEVGMGRRSAARMEHEPSGAREHSEANASAPGVALVERCVLESSQITFVSTRALTTAAAKRRQPAKIASERFSSQRTMSSTESAADTRAATKPARSGHGP